jgi:hypothetical protein
MEVLWTVIWDILIVTIVFKLIILKGVANFLVRWFKNYVSRTDRRLAIAEHFRLQLAGHGHESKTVLTCGQDNCQVFLPA